MKQEVKLGDTTEKVTVCLHEGQTTQNHILRANTFLVYTLQDEAGIDTPIFVYSHSNEYLRKINCGIQDVTLG